MADNYTARQSGDWTVVSTKPDVCKTPKGGSTPPIPYPVTANMATAVGGGSDSDTQRLSGRRACPELHPENNRRQPRESKGHQQRYGGGGLRAAGA
ncbi:PAAR-like domain-containing protein [Hafnia alvei]|uniref:PAAR-like domain-containing protein n=1 Tax=Hafnia alvei TaxID=569 RepID=UPI00345F119A